MLLAGEADDMLGVVEATWHAALIDRDRHRPNDALKLFQLAQMKLLDLVGQGSTKTRPDAAAEPT